MKTVYRVAVCLAWLVATLTVGAAAATGNAPLWRVAEAGSVVGQGVAGLGEGTTTNDRLGLYAAYMDQRAAIDRSHTEQSDAGGIFGWLADHELAVAVAVTFAWVAIGAWAVNRGFEIPHARRRRD